MVKLLFKLFLITELSILNAQITKELFIGEWKVDKESYQKHIASQMGLQKIDLNDPKLKDSRMYPMIVNMVKMGNQFSYVFKKDSVFVKMGPGEPIPSGDWKISGSEIHLIGDRKSVEGKMGKEMMSMFTEDEIKEMLITKLFFTKISDSVMEFDYEGRGRSLKFNKK